MSNKIIDKIFKDKKVVQEKLLQFGFIKNENSYFYQTLLLDGQLKMLVWFKNEEVLSQVFDIESLEEYSLFLVEGAVGNFVGQVKSEYESVLKKIAEECCEDDVFKEVLTKKVINYIYQNYENKLEFLWKKFLNNAIWRRDDNRKWYGVLSKISMRKLGVDNDEVKEILIVRVKSNEIENIIDNKTYFQGYHMNKRHWVSICLDGSVSFDEICQRIDESFALAKN